MSVRTTPRPSVFALGAEDAWCGELWLGWFARSNEGRSWVVQPNGERASVVESRDEALEKLRARNPGAPT